MPGMRTCCGKWMISTLRTWLWQNSDSSDTLSGSWQWTIWPLKSFSKGRIYTSTSWKSKPQVAGLNAWQICYQNIRHIDIRSKHVYLLYTTSEFFKLWVVIQGFCGLWIPCFGKGGSYKLVQDRAWIQSDKDTAKILHSLFLLSGPIVPKADIVPKP